MKRATKRILKKVLGALLLFGPPFGGLAFACQWNVWRALVLVGTLVAAVAIAAVMFYGGQLLSNDK